MLMLELELEMKSEVEWGIESFGMVACDKARALLGLGWFVRGSEAAV